MQYNVYVLGVETDIRTIFYNIMQLEVRWKLLFLFRASNFHPHLAKTLFDNVILAFKVIILIKRWSFSSAFGHTV